MKILFASQNRGKQQEALALFAGLAVELVFPQDVPELAGFDVEEIGDSFIEIAILKARSYALKSGLTSVADDSGVTIDALEGMLGTKSNRWFTGTADERNQEVLRLLADTTKRTARYTTAACLFDPITEEYCVFEEHQEGSIGTQIIGDEGFDYDRIFIPQGYDQTFAQLGNEVKNKDSQRARALRKIKTYIEKVLA